MLHPDLLFDRGIGTSEPPGGNSAIEGKAFDLTIAVRIYAIIRPAIGMKGVID
jgi:hypothetical protein